MILTAGARGPGFDFSVSNTLWKLVCAAFATFFALFSSPVFAVLRGQLRNNSISITDVAKVNGLEDQRPPSQHLICSASSSHVIEVKLRCLKLCFEIPYVLLKMRALFVLLR